MLLVTDDMRSMIASLFIASRGDPAFAPCCSNTGYQICSDIVGAEYASSLRVFFYESLGCSRWGIANMTMITSSTCWRGSSC